MCVCMYVCPPTPAASRGSESEEAFLATRGEERKLDKHGRPQVFEAYDRVLGPELTAGKSKV